MSLTNLSNQLSDELSTKKDNFSFFKKVGVKTVTTTLLALGLASGSALLYHSNHADNINSTSIVENITTQTLQIKSKSDVISQIKNSVAKKLDALVENNIKNAVRIKEITGAIQFPIYTSSLVNAKQKVSLEEIAQFKVPEGMKDNQIGRMLAQHTFLKQQFSISLRAEVESYIGHIGHDNIGYMIGLGTNPSVQKVSYNIELIKAVTTDNKVITDYSSLSGKLNGISNVNITMSPQRALQMSQIHANQDYIGLLSVIAKEMKNNSLSIAEHKKTGLDYPLLAKKLYDNLKSNEQAVLDYQVYNKGVRGFSNYKGLLKELITYNYAPVKTEELSNNVGKHIVTFYKVNGKKLQSVRSDVLNQAMWSSPEAYGVLIGSNLAPKNMKNIAIIAENNIDVSAKNIVISDNFEKAKAEAIASGKQLNITPDYTQARFSTGLRAGEDSTNKGTGFRHAHSGF